MTSSTTHHQQGGGSESSLDLLQDLLLSRFEGFPPTINKFVSIFPGVVDRFTPEFVAISVARCSCFVARFVGFV